MPDLAMRLTRSFAVPLSVGVVSLTLLALVAISVVALVYGGHSRFLCLCLDVHQPVTAALNLVKLLLFPALTEELIFRVLLLPPPTTKTPTGSWLAWTALSVGLFVVYHVIFSWLRPQAQAVLRDRRFLVLVTWVGIVLSTLYGLTGSLWAIALVHWLIVVGWLYGFGGRKRLRGQVPTGAT
ncbi:MAG: CPBP family glutamic-type intramembrane protease [Cyanobacteria bacterium P01_C01_bin.120]